MSGTIAIIGTAGRNDDAPRITRDLYDAMYAHTLEAISDWGCTKAVSGGAAVADHLAVRAFLEGAVDSLKLYLPARFDGRRYVPNPAVPSNPGRTTNQYHDAFSEVCGIDSLTEIAEAIRNGAKVEVHEGFKRRNLEVANACTHMLALTFGNTEPPRDILPTDPGFTDHRAAGLKDGGTQHTWTECWKATSKRHVCLHRLRDIIGAA